MYDLIRYNNEHKECLSYLKYEDYSPEQIELIGYKRNKFDFAKEIVEDASDRIIKEAKKLIPENYEYEIVNIDNEINKYIEEKIKIELRNTDVSYAREYRTFGGGIPKKDIEKFPILEQYKGKDISYIVTESIEIL